MNINNIIALCGLFLTWLSIVITIIIAYYKQKLKKWILISTFLIGLTLTFFILGKVFESDIDNSNTLIEPTTFNDKPSYSVSIEENNQYPVNPTETNNITKTELPFPSKTINPINVGNDFSTLYIQLKNVYAMTTGKKDGTEYFRDYGYNNDTSDTELEISGKDENYNVLWTTVADYINNGLYSCLIPKKNYCISINKYYTHYIYYEYDIFESPLIIHYGGEIKIEITWVKGSVKEVKELVSQAYRYYSGYESLILDNDFRTYGTKIRLDPGCYQIIYKDGSSREIWFQNDGEYDLSKIK